MTSFIEIPQLGVDGRDLPSLYVNVADIISLQADHLDTLLEIRGLGTRTTYLPLGMVLDVLRELARWPGVRSWSEWAKAAYREPARERARRTASGEHDDDTSEPPSCR